MLRISQLLSYKNCPNISLSWKFSSSILKHFKYYHREQVKINSNNCCTYSFLKYDVSHLLQNRSFQKEYKFNQKYLERSGILKNIASYHTSARNCQKNDEIQKSGSGGNDDDEKDKYQKEKRRFTKISLTILAITVLEYIYFTQHNDGDQTYQNTKDISWNEFINNFLANGEVEQIVVKPNMNFATIFLHQDAIVRGKKVTGTDRQYTLNIVDVQQFENRLREAEDLLRIKPHARVPVIYQRNDVQIDNSIISAIIIVAILGYALRKSGGSSINISNSFQILRAKFTAVDPLIPGSGKGVKFSDVAGSEQAKIEVLEFVGFLKDPTRYQKLGAKVPKGALLLGPPGCGKTLLAKAVASEGNVPFLSMNGSEFIEVIGGVGAARVRDLFKAAQARAPCIIYIDEIDAIGRQRSTGMVDPGGQEVEQTLNQLLVEMDGIMTKERVILLASTNRMDILDKALLRPGRFDRHIVMELPTLEERKLIFDHHLKTITLEKEFSTYSQHMASLTLGSSGADIANVVNEAALYAARLKKKKVDKESLEYAVERQVGGTEKKSQVLSPEEKKVVAFHEAGHVLVGWLTEHTDALLKVTIVPRTNQALAFTRYNAKDKYLHSEKELFQKMCMALGGRVAESLIFNRVSTRAQDDLEKVTDLAYAQVRSFGFNKEVGQVSYLEDPDNKFAKKYYSKKLSATIDREVSKLTFEAYKATEEIINNNIGKLKLLAENLMKKETLFYDDVVTILGPPAYEKKSAIEPGEFENEMQSWKNE